ncbi:MAG TPA: hypothetical protein VK050_08590 [Flavobacteriaceae bacterium]|nr:hypothetical protein [Flavobacteriaceae bacterium]
MKIQETKAFKAMNATRQHIALLKSNRNRINNNVGIAKTIGLERWKEVATGLPEHWKAIVRELAAQ